MKHRRGEPLPPEVQRLLAPFFPGFDLSRVRIHQGIPRYVMANPVGYADRNRIYLAPGFYRVDTAEGLALIAHELAHCRQYQRYGAWRFRAKYLADYFNNLRSGMPHDRAYMEIPFEVEARKIEQNVHAAMSRMQSLLNPSGKA